MNNCVFSRYRLVRQEDLAVGSSADGNGPLGEVKFFGENLKDAKGEKLKIPHMGWNGVHHQSNHPLWHNIAEGSRFYFVHSYYMAPQDSSVVLATTDYGFEFVSAIGRANVFAVQFHPEKSAQDGLQLLKNFSLWDGQL